MRTLATQDQQMSFERTLSVLKLTRLSDARADLRQRFTIETISADLVKHSNLLVAVSAWRFSTGEGQPVVV